MQFTPIGTRRHWRKSLATASAVALVIAAGSASAEIKGDAIRLGVLTDMNGVFATAGVAAPADKRARR